MSKIAGRGAGREPALQNLVLGLQGLDVGFEDVQSAESLARTGVARGVGAGTTTLRHVGISAIRLSRCFSMPPSAREPPPPRPLCKPLGPLAPLVAIPLEVVQGPTQLVVAGPDHPKELLNV